MFLPNADLEWRVVGIVTFGYACENEDGSPAVYTRVTSFLDWIHGHIGTATTVT